MRPWSRPDGRGAGWSSTRPSGRRTPGCASCSTGTRPADRARMPLGRAGDDRWPLVGRPHRPPDRRARTARAGLDGARPGLDRRQRRGAGRRPRAGGLDAAARRARAVARRAPGDRGSRSRADGPAQVAQRRAPRRRRRPQAERHPLRARRGVRVPAHGSRRRHRRQRRPDPRRAARRHGHVPGARRGGRAPRGPPGRLPRRARRPCSRARTRREPARRQGGAGGRRGAVRPAYSRGVLDHRCCRSGCTCRRARRSRAPRSASTTTARSSCAPPAGERSFAAGDVVHVRPAAGGLA